MEMLFQLPVPSMISKIWISHLVQKITFLSFGSGLVGKRTGVIFNSCMDDFSIANKSNLFALPPAPTNFIEPQKRAMSSMSPLILANKNGVVRLVIGAAGGSKIISSLAEIIARVIWFGDDIKQAIDAQRIHNQLVPNVLVYQEDIDQVSYIFICLDP